MATPGGAKKLDFVVVVDTFQTPTSMALADIFLPAAAIGEKESFRNWWWPLTNAVKAVDAGDTRPIGRSTWRWPSG